MTLHNFADPDPEHLEGAVCDIQSTSTAAKSHLVCKGIVEKWCPEEGMKLCVVI